MTAWLVAILGLGSAVIYPLSIHYCGPLAAIALSPLALAACLARTSRQTALLGFLSGWLGCLLLQHTLWVVSFPGTILLSAYQGLTWIAVVLGTRGLWLRWHLPQTLAWPVVWVAGEFIRTLGPLGTNFGVLTVPATTQLWMLQIADLGGLHLVSLPIAMTQGFVADLFLAGRKSSAGGRMERLRLPVTLLAGTWLASAAYGHWRLGEVESRQSEGPRIALVTPDVVATSIEGAFDGPRLLRELQRMSEAAVREGDKPALVVWPEAIVSGLVPNKALVQASYDPRMDGSFGWSASASPEEEPAEHWLRSRKKVAEAEQEFVRWVDRLGVPVLVGAAAWKPAPPGDERAFLRYNAALRFDPGKGQADVFQGKVRRYPFGEYSPWAGIWLEPILDSIVGPPRRHYEAAVDRFVFPLDGTPGGVRTIVIFCNEIKFERIPGRLISPEDGAKPFQFIIHMANEGLFRRNGMNTIFAYCNVVRAIERRIPIVRCSNAGITGFVAPTGATYGEVVNHEGKARFVRGAPEAPLIEELVAFRRSAAFDPLDPDDLARVKRSQDEIEAVRRSAATPGWTVQTIRLYNETTVYQRIGHLVGPTFIAFLVLAIGAGLATRSRAKPGTSHDQVKACEQAPSSIEWNLPTAPATAHGRQIRSK